MIVTEYRYVDGHKQEICYHCKGTGWREHLCHVVRENSHPFNQRGRVGRFLGKCACGLWWLHDSEHSEDFVDLSADTCLGMIRPLDDFDVYTIDTANAKVKP